MNMEHIVNMNWDEEARVWYAVCDSIPLALESNSFDALIERVKNVAPEILAENGITNNSSRICFRTERFVSLLLREPFDYTAWRSSLQDENISLRNLSHHAMSVIARQAHECDNA